MRLKARSSRLTFAFSRRLQSTSSEFRLALSSAACVWAATSSSRVLKVAATGTASDPKVRQLHPARARNTPPAHERQQEWQPTSSVSRTTRVQLPATSAAGGAHTARATSRSQPPGTKLPRLACRRKWSAGSHAARSNSLPRAVSPSQQHDSKDNAVLERLSEVLMGSTCAE